MHSIVLPLFFSLVQPRPLLGVEFTSVPCATNDVVPLSSGPWMVSASSAQAPSLLRPPLSDRPASLDSDGWPIEDAYLIPFVATPDAADPAAFVAPGLYGAYAISFSGSASQITLAPQLNASLSNVTFDAATWTTSATLLLHPPLPGIALGFSGTRRSPGAPLGSGITHLRIVQPSGSAAFSAGLLFSPPLVASLAPFSHTRLMTFTSGASVVGFENATQPGLEVALGWADRTRFTDALWLPGLPSNPKAFGAPWEAVVLLGQQAEGRVGVWITIPVQAAGDYVEGLVQLLRDGNQFTGGRGLPEGLPIYIEHGNEVWLNGSQAAGGGPSAAYLYNKAAAIAEVAANPASALNEDGCNDAETWAYRRHLLRVAELGAAFLAGFGSASFGAQVRPALGWCQLFPVELVGLKAWYDRALAPSYGALNTIIYGVAINGYAVSGVLPGATEASILASVLQASDAQRPPRAAMAAIVAPWGVKLMTYEGALVCLPLEGDAATTGAVIQANRGAGWGNAMVHDYEANWAGAGAGGEFNFFALASQYGGDSPQMPRYQWGLLEDVANLTAAKYKAVAQIAGGGGMASSEE